MKHIYGTALSSLNGRYRNGMVELQTDFADENSDIISFPIEATPKLIEFLKELIK